MSSKAAKKNTMKNTAAGEKNPGRWLLLFPALNDNTVLFFEYFMIKHSLKRRAGYYFKNQFIFLHKNVIMYLYARLGKYLNMVMLWIR